MYGSRQNIKFNREDVFNFQIFKNIKLFRRQS